MSRYYLRLQKDAEKFAAKAMSLLKKQQRHITSVKLKDAVDMVTSSDLAAEKLIIDSINSLYPDHSIYSEEVGETIKKSKYTWIIDPLDGTKEYSKGLTEYACLIAVEEQQKLIVGVCCLAVGNELFSTASGSGSYCNGEKVKVSQTNTLGKALVGFHVPTSKNSSADIEMGMNFMKKLILNCYRLRPGWFDVKLMTWVARGALDAHIIGPDVNDWYDVAPALLLIEEAGGKVTDMFGEPIKNRDLSKGVLASNGKIHDTLLNIIQSQ